MSTSIPPHNLTEVIDGLIKIVEDPEIKNSDLMKIIKGPDFPTAGFIYGSEGIKNAYETGRGIIQVRALAQIEPHKKGDRDVIIISELPYQVNKAKLLEHIANLVRDKKIEGISDIRDESDREGMRIVLELKKGNQPAMIKILKDAIKDVNEELKLNRALDCDVDFGADYSEIH